MGSFLFKWDHPAEEVYVTGTFDDWGRSVRLEKTSGRRHEKLVELPNADEKILYKFVVDNEWITDHTAPQETDKDNNTNNVLLPENITKHPSPRGNHSGIGSIMSGVTPGSTTAKLAGNVPKELDRDLRGGSSTLPGSFPETPATEPAEFKIDPIPATAGFGNPIQLKPGEKVPDPSTLTSNTISSTVRDDLSLAKSNDKSPQTFRVNPLPATAGIGNPIKIKPGEKLPDPSTFTKNTINSTVTLDKRSFDAGAPQLPEVVTPQKERDANGAGLFGLPGWSSTLIPESSLPVGGSSSNDTVQDPGFAILSSVGPQSTTAALAGKVPLEPRRVLEQDREPTIQSTGPEASTAGLAGKVPLERREKDVTVQSVGPQATTAGLAGKVPLESQGKDSRATIQSVGPEATTAGLAGKVPLEHREKDVTVQSVGPEATTAGLAGKVPLEHREKDVTVQSVGPEATTAGLAGKVPLEHREKDVTVQSVGPEATTAGLAGKVPLETTGVPDIVQKSQKLAGVEPEAAANPEAVQEKSQVDNEIERTIPEEPVTSSGTAPGKSGAQGGSTAKGGLSSGGIAGLAGGAAAGGAAIAAGIGHQALKAASSVLPQSVQQSIGEINRGSIGATGIASTVPDVVQESITKSHQSPEAAASKEVVGEKSAVEAQILKQVTKETTSGEPAPTAGKVTPGFAGVGHQVSKAAASIIPQSVQKSINELNQGSGGSTASSVLPQSVQKSINELNLGSGGSTASSVLPQSVQKSINELNLGSGGSTAIASTVPDVVQESITKSHQSPEAAASQEVVAEKSAVEAQILKQVPKETTGGEPAPSAGTVHSKSAPAAGIGHQAFNAVSSVLPQSVQQSINGISTGSAGATAIAPTVPDIVQESITKSHQSPEAAVSKEVVSEKSAVEAQLLKQVPKETLGGEHAPSFSAAQSASIPAPTAKSTETPLSKPTQSTVAPVSHIPNSTVTPIKDTKGVGASPAEGTTSQSGAQLAPPAGSATATAAAKPTIGSPDTPSPSHGSTSSPPTQPVASTGLGSSTTIEASNPLSGKAPVTPTKSAAVPSSSKTPESGSSAGAETFKKSKRASFFGKLKSRFDHRHDKDKHQT